MTPAQRAGLLADLAAHVEAHAPALLADPPSPAGCVVLAALTVDCAALAIGGSLELPEHGVRVRGPRG